MDESQIPCVGKAMVPLSIDSNVIEVNCLVAKHLFGNIDVVVEMDVIRRLGGVVVTRDSVTFLNTFGKSGILNKKVWSSDAKGKALKSELIDSVAATASRNDIVINDADFEARFDGNIWSVVALEGWSVPKIEKYC